MENGSFQPQLEKFEFQEENFSFQKISNPSKKEPASTLGQTAIHEVSSASSIDTLILQNEDLTARLRVTLKKMSHLESENEALLQESEKVKTSFSALNDQLLIWKEKEKIWQEKLNNYEAQMKEIKNRFPELETMESSLARYKKYHEKVKSQIKPYIHQLKEYAQNLAHEIRRLHSEIEEKNLEIRSLNQEKLSLREDLDNNARMAQESINQLTEIFEKDRKILVNEINSLKESNALLENRAAKLSISLERQDDLENMVIALRRSKDELTEQYHHEVDALRMSTQHNKQALLERDLVIENLKSELDILRKSLHKTETHAATSDEQLTSLRYLWNSKSEELEKLKLSHASLEKINSELSSKLNQMRKGSAN